MSDKVSFRIFIGDGQWKLNRDEEFVCVFESREAAVNACGSYREEIVKHGGEATIVVDEADGSTTSV
ncbi:hypothetical protein [Rhizobium sp.]